MSGMYSKQRIVFASSIRMRSFVLKSVLRPVLQHAYILCRFQTKRPGQKKAPGKAGQRYWKNVGLGFKTPKEAIEGEILVKQQTSL